MPVNEDIRSWLAELAGEAAAGATTQVSRNLAGRVIEFAHGLERRGWSCQACGEPAAQKWKFCPMCGGDSFLRQVAPEEEYDAPPGGRNTQRDPFTGGADRW